MIVLVLLSSLARWTRGGIGATATGPHSPLVMNRRGSSLSSRRRAVGSSGVPGRLVRSGPRLWLRLPDLWPWAEQFMRAWERLRAIRVAAPLRARVQPRSAPRPSADSPRRAQPTLALASTRRMPSRPTPDTHRSGCSTPANSRPQRWFAPARAVTPLSREPAEVHRCGGRRIAEASDRRPYPSLPDKPGSSFNSNSLRVFCSDLSRAANISRSRTSPLSRRPASNC